MKTLVFLVTKGRWSEVMFWLKMWMVTWKGHMTFESWDLRPEPLVHCRIFWQRAAKEEVLGG